MNTHRGRSKPARRSKPMELIARGPHEVYSWDITYLPTEIKGMFYFLYFFLDIYSRKIVGYQVEMNQSDEHASKLIKRICDQESIRPEQLALHSDNGGPMKGATMLATLQALGVIPSFSRPIGEQ